MPREERPERRYEHRANPYQSAADHHRRSGTRQNPTRTPTFRDRLLQERSGLSRRGYHSPSHANDSPENAFAQSTDYHHRNRGPDTPFGWAEQQPGLTVQMEQFGLHSVNMAEKEDSGEESNDADGNPYLTPPSDSRNASPKAKVQRYKPRRVGDFADPFAEGQRFYHRDERPGPKEIPIEFMDPSKRKFSQAHKENEMWLRRLANEELRPEDVPVRFLKRLKKNPKKKKMRLAAALNVFLGHSATWIFVTKYSDEKYRGNNSRIQKLCETGAIIEGPFFTVHNDQSVGIEDLSRVHTIHGDLSAKKRKLLVLEVWGMRALVLFTTSFSDSLEPPGALRDKCIHIAHESSKEDFEDIQDMTSVRFSGNDCLDKRSFMKTFGLAWLELDTLPYSREGELVPGDREKVADKLGMPHNCQLRRKDRMSQEEYEDAKAGKTAEAMPKTWVPSAAFTEQEMASIEAS